MRKPKYSLFLIILIGMVGCSFFTDFFDESQNGDAPIKVLFFLTDSTGNENHLFAENEEIYFHFAIVNLKDSPLSYHKSHGGPPIVQFVVMRGDKVVGRSDDGYGYPAVVTGGTIPPQDTLRMVAAWYSNPYHPTLLIPGVYQVRVSPYIWFEEIDLEPYLSTLSFEILN